MWVIRAPHPKSSTEPDPSLGLRARRYYGSSCTRPASDVTLVSPHTGTLFLHAGVFNDLPRLGNQPHRSHGFKVPKVLSSAKGSISPPSRVCLLGDDECTVQTASTPVRGQAGTWVCQFRFGGHPVLFGFSFLMFCSRLRI